MFKKTAQLARDGFPYSDSDVHWRERYGEGLSKTSLVKYARSAEHQILKDFQIQA